jgi:hypothetical protein
MKYKTISDFLINNKYLLLVLVIHFVILQVSYFPIGMLFDGKVIVTDDYPYHYYQLLMSEHYLPQGKILAYDPFFFSGWVVGINLMDFSFPDILLCLIRFALFFVPTLLTFKIYIYFFNLVIPLVIYFAARNFKLTKAESVLIALLTTIAWRFDYLIYQMNSSGVFSFVFVSYLCIFIISLFYKFLLTNKRKYFISASFFCVISILIHPYSIIILLVPLIVFIFFFKNVKLKEQKFLPSSTPFLTTLIFVIIFLVSLLFILNETNVFSFEPAIFHQSEGLKTIFFELQVRPFQTIIFFLGIFGLFLWRKERKIFILFLATSIFYFAYSYFGSLIVGAISYLQPERVVVPLTFLLIIPSAKSIQYITKVKSKTKMYAIAFIALLLFFSFLKVPDLYFNIKNEEEWVWNRRITTSMQQDVQDLISWIKGNTTSEARILIENSGYKSGWQYSDGHLLAMFPYFTNREFVVSPMPYASIKKGFIPDFYEGILFSKNITDFTQADFEKYFNLYNIKWIVVWSNESKSVFDNLPQVSKVKQTDKFSIYQTKIQPTFFLQGSGVITAGYNKITVSNASGGELVIKYNYFEWLKTNPKLEIKKYKILNGNLAFIKISNPDVPYFEIYMN